jgi:hypothetical protein
MQRVSDQCAVPTNSMVRTKNVTPAGGDDDQDPPCPFRQDNDKEVYLEQQGGKRRENWTEPLEQQHQLRGQSKEGR